MVWWFLEWRLSAVEKKLGVSLEYARRIARASLGAFRRFLKLPAVADYRRVMPAEPFYAARVVATRHEGCAECVQTTVSQARAAGLSQGLLQAALAARWAEMPEEVA